jgi:uncharacterized protein YoxC
LRFVKELDDYKAFDDDIAQKARFIETGFETMEEFSDSVQKLLSMYDLERFIAEQERLIKRVPELEEEVRQMQKPRCVKRWGHRKKKRQNSRRYFMRRKLSSKLPSRTCKSGTRMLWTR